MTLNLRVISSPRRWTIAGAVILAVVVAGFVRIAHRPPKGALLPQYEYNFGEAEPRTAIQHTFVLRNPYRTPLHIERILSSCSCTVIGQRPERIEPGSQILLPVEMKLPDLSSEVGSTVRVYFQEHQPVDLRIRVEIFPSSITFGRVLRGARSATTVVLAKKANAPLVVKNIEYNRDHLDISDAPSEPNASRAITVGLRDAIPYGPFKETLRITTDAKMEPQRTIEVSGYILRPVESQQERIAVELDGSRQTAVQPIHLYSPYHQPFVVTYAEATPAEMFDCRVEDAHVTSAGVDVPILIRRLKNKTVQRGRVRITCAVNGGESQTVTMDVYAMNRSSGSGATGAND